MTPGGSDKALRQDYYALQPDPSETSFRYILTRVATDLSFEASCVNPDGVIEALFGPEGLRLIPSGAANVIVEPGASVPGLRRRCRAAVSRLAAGEDLIVVIALDATGITKMCRWLLLPFQIAAAADAIAANGIVVGRYVVAPDLARPTVVYELHSLAQRYAEAFLLFRPRRPGIAGGIRRAIALWTGCDPAAGAIVIVGRKP